MLTKPFYRDLLKSAWALSWHNKRLWFLGIFAAFWGATGAQHLLSWGNSLLVASEFWRLKEGGPLPQLASFSSGPVSFASVLGLAALTALVVFILWFVTACRGGLFWSILRIQKGEKKPTVGQMLREGTDRFWPIFAVGLASKAVLGFLFVLLSFLIFKLAGMSPAALGVSLFILSFVIVVLLALAVSFLSMYAALFVVAEDLKFYEAWKRALRLFAVNWLITLETALIFYVLSILAVLAVLVAAGIFAIPILLLLVIMAMLPTAAGFWLIAIPMGILFLALVVLAESFLITFQFTAWTLLFLRLFEAARPVPKVERIYLAVARRFRLASKIIL